MKILNGRSDEAVNSDNIETVKGVDWSDETVAGNAADIATNTAGIAAMTQYAMKANAKIIKTTLDEGIKSVVINVIGDSTGNEDTEWVRLLATDLHTAYPEYNIKHALFDSVSSKYPALTTLYSAGADRHILSTGTGYVRRLSGSVVSDDYTDVDFRVRIKKNWNTGVLETIGGQYDSAGLRAWRVYISAAGQIIAEFSADGSTQEPFYNALNVTSFDADTIYYLRFVIDVNNGAAGKDFYVYRSENEGVSWTQLAKKTEATASSLYKSTVAHYFIGGYAGNGAPFNGRIYSAELMDSIGGNSNILPVSLETWNSYNGTPFAQTVEGTPEVLIYNSSISGYGTSDYDTALLQKTIVNGFGNIVIVSLSHNETKEYGYEWILRLKTICDTIKTLTYKPIIALMTQNPQRDPANPQAQAQRRNEMISFANENGYDCIDVYGGFIAAEKAGVTGLISGVDGIHPTEAGSLVWKNYVKSYLGL